MKDEAEQKKKEEEQKKEEAILSLDPAYCRRKFLLFQAACSKYNITEPISVWAKKH